MNAEAFECVCAGGAETYFPIPSLSPGTVKLIPHKNQYLMSTFYYDFFLLCFSNMSLDDSVLTLCVILVCVVLFVAPHVTCQLNFRSVTQTAVVVATEWKIMRDIPTLWFLYCHITCEREGGRKSEGNEDNSCSTKRERNKRRRVDAERRKIRLK